MLLFILFYYKWDGSDSRTASDYSKYEKYLLFNMIILNKNNEENIKSVLVK